LAALVCTTVVGCGGSTNSSGTDSLLHSATPSGDAAAEAEAHAPAPDGSVDGTVVDGMEYAGDSADALEESATDAIALSPSDGAAETLGDSSQPPDASLDASPAVDASACALRTATVRATAARSTGYGGTWEAYGNLYYVPCAVASDCVSSCVEAGGTQTSCSLGSQCTWDGCADGGISQCLMCLPPTYWLDVTGALGLPDSGANPLSVPATDNQAFDNGYNDTLEITGFGLAVPSGSVIRGLSFQVDRSADDDQASDESVRILKSGVPVGVDHALNQTWPQGVYATVTYGGAGDTWGVSWTAADVNGSAFGVAITPQYLSSAGNDHVDIDSVVASVVYSGSGCP